jgi:hypothetical protein
MVRKIKYTVKHHPRSVKKIAHVLFLFAVIIGILFGGYLSLFNSLSPELQILAMAYLVPDVFWDFFNIAMISVAIGFGLTLFKWRYGKLELTDEKLIIEGSYRVSIWLKNIWTVEFIDTGRLKGTIRIDSNVDAVQIRFRSLPEYQEFTDQFIDMLKAQGNEKVIEP